MPRAIRFIFPPAHRLRPACLALAALAFGAAAQTPGDAGPMASPEVALPDERIVVTATHSAQPALRLPVSIDSLTSETLQDGRAQVNLSESLGRVPGLVAQSRQNYAQDLQISSRGFGARASFGVRGIRLLADGIPASMPDGQGQVAHFDLASAARIEVLRGPFSVLYGNASGGVIALFTAAGDPGQTVQASGSLGSFGAQRVALKSSGDDGHINHTIALTRFVTDGYRDHSAAQRDSLNARLSLASGEQSKLTLIGNVLDMPEAEDPLGLTAQEWRNDPRQAGSGARQFNTRKRLRQEQLGATWTHDLRNAGTSATLLLSAWAGARTVRQFLAIPVAAQAAATHSGGVVDLQRDFSGLDARWTQHGQWLGGALESSIGFAYETQDEARRGFDNFDAADPRMTGVVGSLRRDEDNRLFSRATYVQTLWTPTPRWQLLAGVRNSEIAVRSQDHFIAPGNPDDSGRLRFTHSTPALGASFAFVPQLIAYAAWGEGFETPTGNELAYRRNGSGLNFALAPTRSVHRELGIKAQPGPGQHLTLARFRVRSDDEIIVDANSGGRSTFRNAGSTTRDGWELAWHAGKNTLSLDLAYTRIDARYRQTSGTIVAGNRIPGIPRQSLYAELGWKHPTSGFSSALELRATDRIFANDANSAIAPSATVLNWRGGFAQQRGRWQWQEFLRVDNLADKHAIGSVIVNAGFARYFEPAPGRNFLAGISLTLPLTP